MDTAKHVNAQPLPQLILHALPQLLEQVAPHICEQAVQASLQPLHAFLHVLMHLSTHALAQLPVQEKHSPEQVVLQSDAHIMEQSEQFVVGI